MSMEKHIADGESSFIVFNVTPDFCKVGNRIIAFDICQTLQPQQADFATSVFARSEQVVLIDSIVAGVQGNAGTGVSSTVAQSDGHSKVIEGSTTVFIESRITARHNDLIEMNGKVG